MDVLQGRIVGFNLIIWGFMITKTSVSGTWGKSNNEHNNNGNGSNNEFPGEKTLYYCRHNTAHSSKGDVFALSLTLELVLVPRRLRRRLRSVQAIN